MWSRENNGPRVALQLEALPCSDAESNPTRSGSFPCRHLHLLSHLVNAVVRAVGVWFGTRPALRSDGLSAARSPSCRIVGSRRERI